MISQNLPKVSIITVVFNGEFTLIPTIKSIASQTYSNIEYIIVDGQSTDSTIDIIKRFPDVIDKWISEPDKGIYDAMNKGLQMATGDYIWFINSGDEIAHPQTLEDVFSHELDGDIYYGDTVMIDKDGDEIGQRRLTPPQKLTWKSFKKGMLVSHQSIIIKKAIACPYNIDYSFSADFEWCLLALEKAKSIINTHITLSKFLDGGVTKQNIVAGLKERFRIMVKHYGYVSTLYHHIFIALRFFSFVTKYRRF
jgi:glycosyltransferase involved in cell wall biosynthesis